LIVLTWVFTLLFPAFRLQFVVWRPFGMRMPIYYTLFAIPTFIVIVFTFIKSPPRVRLQCIWWLFSLSFLPGILISNNALWGLRQWVSLWLRGLALGAALASLIETSLTARHLMTWILMAAIAAGLLGLGELIFDRNPLLDSYMNTPISKIVPADSSSQNGFYKAPSNFAGSRRPMGTQGNRIPYLMCIVPFIFVIASQIINRKRPWPLYVLAFVLLLYLILWAHVLTSWVGLIAGLIVYLVVLSPRSPRTARMLLLGIFGLFLFCLLIPQGWSSFISGIHHFNLNDPDIRHRIASYSTVRALRGHLLFGLGYGNYNLAYLKFYTGPLLNNPAPDNQYLCLLIENGLIGFGAYLFFLITLLYSCTKRIQSMSDSNERIFYTGLLAASISITIMLLFFDGLNWMGPNMTFWCILGVLTSSLNARDALSA
jgi:O-antigen ligase